MKEKFYYCRQINTLTLLGFLISATALATPWGLAGVTPQKEVVATKLNIPWQLAFAPGKRIFISERKGRILAITLDGSENGKENKREVWATLKDVVAEGEGGLMGIALHPAFTTTPYVYIAYTAKVSARSTVNRLVRYREFTDKSGSKVGRFDKILLDKLPAAYVHNGGRLKFYRDGTLLWAMGDVAKASTAQDKNALTGKLLRLNADGSIPANNPFPNSYVYSYGHRNIQGIAFDARTGRIFTSEHGPSSVRLCCRDEVNEIFAGSNYGWPVITGDQKKAGMLSPLVTSGESNTWAPAGIVYVKAGAWKDSLLMVGLRGKALYRLSLNIPKQGGQQATLKTMETYYKNELGRLRDIAQAPEAYGFSGHYYFVTSNRNSYYRSRKVDDRLFRLLLP